MRVWRVLLAVAAVLLGAGGVSAGVAAWLLPARIDPASLRGALAALAADRLDSTVTIEGKVGFSLFPRPVLEASQVSLLHASPGDPDGVAVTAASLRARLSLADLLRGHLSAAGLELHGAVVQAPFPFDIRALTVGRPQALRHASISLQDSDVQIGAIEAREVDATLLVDPETGAVTVSGRFRLAGGSAWRGVLHLSPPGGDGSAALQATLEEVYAADGLSVALSGQLAGDGAFAGRLLAAGPDLSRLLPAPPAAFRVTGRALLGDGIATLQDAALNLADAASQLGVTWHFAEPARLDVALTASRLDLDAWRPALRTAPAPGLPVGLTVAAAAAKLAGGMLRDLRLTGMAGPDGALELKQGSAVLPGGLATEISGGFQRATGSGHFQVRLDGTDFSDSAAWLGHLLGAAVTLPLPRVVAAGASIGVAAREVAVHDIDATLDGVVLRGEATVGWPQGAPRPTLGATLALDHAPLLPLAAWADGLPTAVDGTLQLTAADARLGMLHGALQLRAALQDGAIALDRLSWTGPDVSVAAHGRCDAAGHWSAASITLAADRLDSLRPLLPESWRDVAVPPGLAGETLNLTAAGGGTLAAPSGHVQADLGALHIDAAPVAGAGGLHGAVSLSHPDIHAVAALLGWPDPVWLGPGGLALSASVSADGSGVTADAVQLRAGLLDTRGRLDLHTGPPGLTGQIDAVTLPLPPFDLSDPTPLPLARLRGLTASIDLAAQHVTGSWPLADLHTHLAIADQVLALTDFSAQAAGGRVGGTLHLDASRQPPQLSAAMAWTDLTLAPFSAPVAVMARMSGRASLTAQGYAGPTLLATLSGEATVALRDAVLLGLDVGAIDVISDAAVTRALQGGRTVLQAPLASLRLDHGLATLTATGTTETGAPLSVSGGVDLPGRTADLTLEVRPVTADSPPLAARISGGLVALAVAPELASLARWRAAHPP